MYKRQDNGTVSLGAREVAKNNPAVTWEKALKRNYGVDINFLDDLSLIHI